MDHGTGILLSLFVAFVAALIGGDLAQRIKLPSVVGQIAAGIAVGPNALGWLQPSDSLNLLSELGAILLLFSVGLETRIADLRKVGRTAFLVGTLGVVLPFILGFAWAEAMGFNVQRGAFVAAAFVATSAGITARVLQEMGVLDSREARIILGAAVIDDILAMLLLGAVSALQTDAGVNILNLLAITAEAILFVVVVAIVGTRLMRRSSRLLDAPTDTESPLPVSFAICLGLAAAAANIGLAAIIGAFLAGMVLAETEHRESLTHDFTRVSALVVPFFFVTTGSQVDPHLLVRPAFLGIVLLVVLLATIGKVVGCGLGALSLGRRSALAVGMGMVPRGEVGVIVASIGQRTGVFNAETYAIIVTMALLTSMLAPPLLKRLIDPAPQLETATSQPEEVIEVKAS